MAFLVALLVAQLCGMGPTRRGLLLLLLLFYHLPMLLCITEGGGGLGQLVQAQQRAFLGGSRGSRRGVGQGPGAGGSGGCAITLPQLDEGLGHSGCLRRLGVGHSGCWGWLRGFQGHQVPQHVSPCCPCQPGVGVGLVSRRLCSFVLRPREGPVLLGHRRLCHLGAGAGGVCNGGHSGQSPP